MYLYNSVSQANFWQKQEKIKFSIDIMYLVPMEGAIGTTCILKRQFGHSSIELRTLNKEDLEQIQKLSRCNYITSTIVRELFFSFCKQAVHKQKQSKIKKAANTADGAEEERVKKFKYLLK